MRPWVTTLSMSAGRASYALWQMLRLGILERPANLIVTNADPGMENSGTKAFVDKVKDQCAEMGVPFLRVERNLYEDIMRVKRGELTRLDNPPFWTKDRITGKRGRLLQGCTAYYKIAPMDAAVRQWMADNIGVATNNTRLGSNAVRCWIGFSADEVSRIKEPPQEYKYFEYPLIEMGWGDSAITAFYIKHGIPMPPRSVCNACYANDVAMFREMYRMRYSDWEQAVAVDEAIRDLSCIGISDECYVSWTLIPLRVLAEMGFPEIDGERDAMKCHSGHCFV
jgi:hypothetical protein